MHEFAPITLQTYTVAICDGRRKSPQVDAVAASRSLETASLGKGLNTGAAL
jgi:hypothetical protein